jgi:hypothetical protein
MTIDIEKKPRRLPLLLLLLLLLYLALLLLGHERPLH